jgi:hypothetical protein
VDFDSGMEVTGEGNGLGMTVFPGLKKLPAEPDMFVANNPQKAKSSQFPVRRLRRMRIGRVTAPMRESSDVRAISK